MITTFHGITYIQGDKIFRGGKTRVIREIFLELVAFELSFVSWENSKKCQGKILDRRNLTKACDEDTVKYGLWRNLQN